MNKIKLAREIAKRSTPRFVEIERERRVTRSTSYRKLIEQHPEVEVRQTAALALKAEQERLAREW